MKIYPADEQRISEVERGRSCEAVLPASPDESPSIGDAILFAHSQSRAGREPSYVKGGDSVLVALTDVADLGETDPATGQALFRVSWKRLGQDAPLDTPRLGKKAPRFPRLA